MDHPAGSLKNEPPVLSNECSSPNRCLVSQTLSHQPRSFWRSKCSFLAPHLAIHLLVTSSPALLFPIRYRTCLPICLCLFPFIRTLFAQVQPHLTKSKFEVVEHLSSQLFGMLRLKQEDSKPKGLPELHNLQPRSLPSFHPEIPKTSPSISYHSVPVSPLRLSSVSFLFNQVPTPPPVP